MVSDTPIVISFSGTEVRGVLWDNSAARSLLSQLPVELSFRDFGAQEKIAALPFAVSLDGMPDGSAASAGTIGYYAPAQALVLYYESVGYFNGIIPVGSFDDVGVIRESPDFTAGISLG